MYIVNLFIVGIACLILGLVVALNIWYSRYLASMTPEERKLHEDTAWEESLW